MQVEYQQQRLTRLPFYSSLHRQSTSSRGLPDCRSIVVYIGRVLAAEAYQTAVLQQSTQVEYQQQRLTRLPFYSSLHRQSTSSRGLPDCRSIVVYIGRVLAAEAYPTAVLQQSTQVEYQQQSLTRLPFYSSLHRQSTSSRGLPDCQSIVVYIGRVLAAEAYQTAVLQQSTQVEYQQQRLTRLPVYSSLHRQSTSSRGLPDCRSIVVYIGRVLAAEAYQTAVLQQSTQVEYQLQRLTRLPFYSSLHRQSTSSKGLPDCRSIVVYIGRLLAAEAYQTAVLQQSTQVEYQQQRLTRLPFYSSLHRQNTSSKGLPDCRSIVVYIGRVLAAEAYQTASLQQSTQVEYQQRGLPAASLQQSTQVEYQQQRLTRLPVSLQQSTQVEYQQQRLTRLPVYSSPVEYQQQRLTRLPVYSSLHRQSTSCRGLPDCQSIVVYIGRVLAAEAYQTASLQQSTQVEDQQQRLTRLPVYSSLHRQSTSSRGLPDCQSIVVYIGRVLAAEAYQTAVLQQSTQVEYQLQRLTRLPVYSSLHRQSTSSRGLPDCQSIVVYIGRVLAAEAYQTAVLQQSTQVEYQQQRLTRLPVYSSLHRQSTSCRGLPDCQSIVVYIGRVLAAEAYQIASLQQSTQVEYQLQRLTRLPVYSSLHRQSTSCRGLPDCQSIVVYIGRVLAAEAYQIASLQQSTQVEYQLQRLTRLPVYSSLHRQSTSSRGLPDCQSIVVYIGRVLAAEAYQTASLQQSTQVEYQQQTLTRLPVYSSLHRQSTSSRGLPDCQSIVVYIGRVLAAEAYQTASQSIVVYIGRVLAAEAYQTASLQQSTQVEYQLQRLTRLPVYSVGQSKVTRLPVCVYICLFSMTSAPLRP